ncbi:UDP-4-amino-4,6-dideoxy-N-acetyl-beta-L-altrosamine N-acetyltransferase [Patescibacteria group bacterium]
MKLTDGTITITPLEKRHLESVRQLRNHPETRRFLTSNVVISKKQQQAWFEKVRDNKSRRYYTIKKEGQFVGIIRSDEWDKANQSVRIGADIVPEFRRQGIATKAYRLFLNYLFNQLKLHRVWFLVVEFNKPAIALYKKLGFKKEGTQRQALFRNGKRYDYLMMALLRKDYDQK